MSGTTDIMEQLTLEPGTTDLEHILTSEWNVCTYPLLVQVVLDRFWGRVLGKGNDTLVYKKKIRCVNIFQLSGLIVVLRVLM